MIYSIFGMAAMLVKKRFPGDHELYRRAGIMLPLFSVMNLLTVQGVYLLYEAVPMGDCSVQRSMQWWVTGFACLASAILTFVNEAGLGWEKWKAAMMETDRLQSAYQKSRLMSLRRQLHPHFLFNCFNTLSSLIQENEQEAEKFLDELTRVYRYLLKGAEEQLVDLGEEMKFIDAYLYLVKTRFGPALDFDIRIDSADETKKIAPMSLLVVLENIIYRNAFSKSEPLGIDIRTLQDGSLMVTNTVQPKPVTGDGPDRGGRAGRPGRQIQAAGQSGNSHPRDAGKPVRPHTPHRKKRAVIMKFSRPLKVQILGFWLSMPFIVLAYNAILYPGRFLTDWRVWTFSWPLIYGIGIVSWYAHIQYDHAIRRQFPTLKETRKRILYKALTNPLIMTPSVLLIFWIYDRWHILGYQMHVRDLKWGYLIGLAINLLFDTLWEVLFLLEKYRESLQEKTLLEK
ncbi:sensor histidine kinase [Puia sp. P3]|uniref:sensor histidine kinase n=1 Tax=Puia sp. P3 TaxID=3423952 RepID=UPI003D6730C3